jgi:hypothetical protein
VQRVDECNEWMSAFFSLNIKKIKIPKYSESIRI